ncbi:hypothetical protein [Actinophytocola xinjiangensis]|uniref:hypothetical protein n=1 Tax=Actinophytocola xinjiangensis TaxID=485602 RepID=UPI0009FBF6E1|nr:hypothetical protein [Actinophytocola xinjiangensis]
MVAEPDPGGDTRTFRADHVVALLCHNQTSVNRLLEAQDLFRGDFRVRFVVVLGEASRFGSGVPRLLREAGVDRVVPWHALAKERYDLALTASENVDFATITGPVALLPHGLGFNKTVPGGLAGLPDASALRTGRVHIVLSHPDQEAQLRATCPEAAGATLVTGDPTFDRLVASLPLRAHYRRLLDTTGRRLVVLASTWGGESALGRRPDLPRRLLAGLPADTYRVALVAHPNIWAEHDARQLAVYYADELDAGLLLLPPQAGWHAALVAADHVITDHGSLALYAAGLGRPLLLTGAADETVPGSPVDDLRHAAPRLDPSGDLVAQLSAADPSETRAVADRVFAHRGEATERLQDVLYRLLGLDPPDGGPALRRAPDPTPLGHHRVSAFRVRVTSRSPGVLAVDRRPAAVHPPSDDRHLAVEETESNLRLTEKASVIYRDLPADPATADTWAASMLDAFPFATLTATDAGRGRCLAVARDGTRIVLTSSAPHPEVPVLASVAHHCLLAPGPSALTVDTGHSRAPIRLEITRPG